MKDRGVMKEVVGEVVGFLLCEEADVAVSSMMKNGCKVGGGSEVSFRIVEVGIIVSDPSFWISDVAGEGLLGEEVTGEFGDVRGDGGTVVNEDVLKMEDGR